MKAGVLQVFDKRERRSGALMGAPVSLGLRLRFLGERVFRVWGECAH